MTREMKNSGIEWIGDIPSDWKIERLGYSLEEIIEKNEPVKTKNILSLLKDVGVVPYEDKGNMGNKSKEDISEYKLAYPDTLVVNSMNILIGSVGISNWFGCVSPVYYVFRETKKSDLRFISYLMLTKEFQKELRRYAKGIMEIRLRISSFDIFKRNIPLPSKLEQTKIADFLDSEVSKINIIINETKESIENYKKYKQSVITEAITQGLEKNISFKKENSVYFSEIPENWCLKKIKYIFIIIKNIAGTEGYDVLSITQNGIKIKDISNNEGQLASNYSNYQLVNIGDYAMNHMDYL